MVKKVNLFLVGAAKCGTTAFAELLAQSPAVYSPPIKEPGFFGSDINPDHFSAEYKKVVALPTDYFLKNNLEDRHQAFIRDFSQYEKLFEKQKDEKYLLDASTVYLLSRLSADEISQYNPEAKIIILLRNPVDRAFSHYKMALQMGAVTTDFATAWETDQSAEKKGIGLSEMFAETGAYSQQLKRYFSIFSKEQICVLLYEDFKALSVPFKSQVESFLEIDLPWNKTTEVNVSSVPKHMGLHQFLKGSHWVKKVKNHLPNPWLRTVKKWMSQKDLQMTDKMKQMLSEYYREDIAEVEKITGLNLNHWK